MSHRRYYYALRDSWYIKDLTEVVSISNQFMVLGGGSNVVFTKQYNGVIIHNQLQESKLSKKMIIMCGSVLAVELTGTAS